ncbi:DUF4287 domain-containing protein [Paradevosia shaoguanensis]|uniref:DUF4287 domain-containing protein n=1 Tax=Paradevosia shaoguanensis TaxID=1335043 RepID=A0AA41QRF7_9HYPH|nr:DUF4287 domain-containing protein [Paradevosia shaoguanensis]MCF1744852.1 DUF4287 domain-containing protein [Paradevosia shaoguanensis]MCI0129335.1 DUF4287 domain-containing protein [Paradevosia shaoguanensis]
MSFQAYLDTIKEKTGKGPSDFIALARAKGFLEPGTKATQIVDWLKDEYDLGRGHAMAIVAILKDSQTPRGSVDERIEKLFSGSKAGWRETYEGLLNRLSSLGEIGTGPTDTYVSLLRGKKKFAILQPGAAHLDIGIKRKDEPATERFAEAGSWNAMVTHRVRVTDAREIDAEVMDWLKKAFEAAK